MNWEITHGLLEPRFIEQLITEEIHAPALIFISRWGSVPADLGRSPKPRRLVTHLKVLSAIGSIDPLVVDGPALPLQEGGYPPGSKPAVDGYDFLDPLLQKALICGY